MVSENQNSRREFIKKVAVTTAAFTIVPRFLLGGNSYIAPSDQLTKAVIGTGAMGRNYFPMQVQELLVYAMWIRTT